MEVNDLARAWAALPQLSNVHASGDGRWAFFCASGLNEVDEVYAVPTDGSTAPVQLTFGVDHHLIRDVSHDGMLLVLAQSHHASEHDHLMLLDRRAGDRLHLLTPKQDSHYVYGGVLTRDGGVLFVADYDYEAEAVIEGAMVWWQSLASGERRCLARTRNFFDRAPLLSPSGRQALLNVNEHSAGGTQVWVMGLDGTELREVLSFGMRNNTRGAWISDDHIAFVTDRAGRDQVGVLTLATGAVEWLGGEPELYPHEVVAGTKGRFACITHDGAHSVAQLWGGGFSDLANRSGRRSLLPHAALPDGGWIAEAYDAGGPHDLVRIGPDGSCLRLTGLVASARTYVVPRDFRWNSPDGRECQGWLYQPNGPSRGFIAYVHGGPTWHSEDWVNPKIGFWVQAGYTVLDPNYRGSTGFGHDWREAVKDDGWGGREQTDIRAGIEACVAQGIALRGKIAVAGNSYGGFSSWFAITRFADLVNAAIPMCGMYRLDIDYHATEMPHGREYSIEMMGGTPEELPEKYANASPGNFIRDIRGQVMIVHGLADSNVGPENTHVAMRELTAAGIPHEVLLFGDEGHGVFRRSNVAAYLARTAAFLDRAFAP